MARGQTLARKRANTSVPGRVRNSKSDAAQNKSKYRNGNSNAESAQIPQSFRGRLQQNNNNSSSSSSNSNEKNDDSSPSTFSPSRGNSRELVSRLEVQLGCTARESEENWLRAASRTLDTLDFDDVRQMKKYQPDFKVQRQPKIAEMSESFRNVFDSTLRAARKAYPQSEYVILQDCEEFSKNISGIIIPQEKDPVISRRRILPELLANGKLYGCKVRGCKESGQYGLVATKDLAAWTPITVDCGMLWSVDKHDEWLHQSKNPMSALSSTTVPLALFEEFHSPLTWKKKFKRHVKEGAFVVDCFSAGNEVKHLDDAGWILAGSGSEELCRANVDAFAVLHLKEPGYISIVYCANQAISKGTELTMNWANWDHISNRLLPAQVFLSHAAQNRLERVLERLRACKKVPSPGKVEEMMNGLSLTEDDVVPSCSLDPDFALAEATKESPKGVLTFLYKVLFDSDALFQSRDTKRIKRGTRVVKDLFSIGIDVTLDRTVRPCDTRMLDDEVCDELDSLETHNLIIDLKVEAMLQENIMDRVEVREILDHENPAKLFALPNQPAYGVYAKRDFAVDEPVLCYGGYLMNKDSTLDELDAYVFEIDDDTLNVDLLINGEYSVAGKINDPLALGGTAKRVANLTSFATYDHDTRNPLVVLYACAPIRKGDELLYSYGAGYWREMWKSIMSDHSLFTAKTDMVSSKLEQLLQEGADP